MIEVCSVLDVEKYSSEFKLILFDLDDTLYSEKDYVRSGFSQVANLFPERNEAEARLWTFFLENRPAIDCLLTERHITDANFKERCLQVYRFHRPQISLYPGVREMLLRMREQKKKLGLITDGRPRASRPKLMRSKYETYLTKLLLRTNWAAHRFENPIQKHLNSWLNGLVPHSKVCVMSETTKQKISMPRKSWGCI